MIMNRDAFCELSLEELSDVVKIGLSVIYQKLREQEGFGYDQHCSVMSIGSEDYDVKACIIDDYGHNNGVSYDNIYWL